MRHDKTGWEPRQLFNVAEFMMHDKVRPERVLCQRPCLPYHKLCHRPCHRPCPTGPATSSATSSATGPATGHRPGVPALIHRGACAVHTRHTRGTHAANTRHRALSRGQDRSGTIDVEECSEILLRRFGKELLETKIKEFLVKASCATPAPRRLSPRRLRAGPPAVSLSPCAPSHCRFRTRTVTTKSRSANSFTRTAEAPSACLPTPPS